MRDPAPSATAGGAFVFTGRGSARTSTYHVPVLADTIRSWAEGSRRAVDGTVGGGGHAALLRAAGAEVLAADRDPAAIAAARAALGETGYRYSTGAFGSAKVQGTIAAFRPDRILLDLGVSSHQLDSFDRGFSFRPGAPLDMRMGAEGFTAADVLNTWPAERLAESFADAGGRAAGHGAAARGGDRTAPRARAVPDERRSGQRDPRDARSPVGSGRFRPAVSGAADRRQSGAGAAGAGPAGTAGRAGAGRAAGRHQLSLGRGSDRQTHLPRMGQALRLPAAPAGLHLPGPAARQSAHAPRHAARAVGDRGEPARPLGPVPRVRGK